MGSTDEKAEGWMGRGWTGCVGMVGVRNGLCGGVCFVVTCSLVGGRAVWLVVCLGR